MELRPATLFIIVFSSLLRCTLSEVKSTKIVSDSSSRIQFEAFGFTSQGFVILNLNSVSWEASQAPNLSSLGFFLSTTKKFDGHHDNFCSSVSDFSFPILTFQDLHNSTGNKTIRVSSADEYVLFFSNCASTSTKITMVVHTEMYNVGSDGERQYLAVGRNSLPLIYSIMFSLYFIFLGFWLLVCYKQRMTVEKIHKVMATLLLLKGLMSACAAEEQWHVQRTGMHHGWDVAFYLLMFTKSAFFFTVIVLIGTGWSSLKPCPKEIEKKVLVVVIPLQVVVNIVRAVIGEGGFLLTDWLRWVNWLEFSIDLVEYFLCFGIAILATLLSIENLSEVAKTDEKAYRDLKKLRLFKNFYLVFVCFNLIASTGIGDHLGYKYCWLVIVIEEAATLMFYLFMFYHFRPAEKTSYLYEEEGASGAQEMEERD